MSRHKTHAQHLKRLAAKERRRHLLDQLFGGLVVSPRLYDYLLRHVDKIATLGEEVPDGR